MKEIIVEKVRVGNFFKKKNVLKIGVDGAPLHDILVSQSDYKLACFHDDKDEKYYLYNLVDGGLIATSKYMIECVSDNYFKMKDDYLSDLKLYCVNHDDNTYTLVNENHGAYDYYENVLVEYNAMDKRVIITDMDSKEKWEFIINDLPDSEFESIMIYYEFFKNDKFIMSICFCDESPYFNCFDMNTKTFLYEHFFNGGVYDVHEHNGNLYVITNEIELINGKGEMLISSFYDEIEFDEELPYIYLEKEASYGLASLQDGSVLLEPSYDEILVLEYEWYAILKKDEKYGLASLKDGKIIFEAKYDEIIEEEKSFIAVSKTYTTYEKEN